IGVHDGTWGPLDAEHRARAVQNVPVIVSTCLRLLLDPRTWGLFWPAFFAAAVLMALGKQRGVSLIAVAVTAAIAIEASVFLITNWDVRLHIEGSYARLLAQLAPAAAVVIGAVAERIWAADPGRVAA